MTPTAATDPGRFQSNAEEAQQLHRNADSKHSLSDEEKINIKPSADNSDDYPHGLTLFFLTLALGLGMFLMALDNVRMHASLSMG